MVGVLLLEQTDDWQDRAYFNMTKYFEWRAATDVIMTPASRVKIRRTA